MNSTDKRAASVKVVDWWDPDPRSTAENDRVNSDFNMRQ